MTQIFHLLIAGLLAIFLLAGCVPTTVTLTAVVYTQVSEATLRPGDPIPQPRGVVVLTLTGKVNAAGESKAIPFDMATLESLGLVSMRVDDRIAEGHEVVFQGVLLSTLLAVVGVSPDATILSTLALNDYSIEIPVSDAYVLPVLVATRADGERMTVEHYGPVRIVYPFGLLPLQPAVHEPRSIWQLVSIEVR